MGLRRSVAGAAAATNGELVVALAALGIALADPEYSRNWTS